MDEKLIKSITKMRERIQALIPPRLTNDNVIFFCIGTDRSTGDAFGPIIGTYLTHMGYKNVYGTLEDPVHAENLPHIVNELPNDKVIIAIDACLGHPRNVGKVTFDVGPLAPGSGVGKKLPKVGDLNIKGIVNTGETLLEYFVLQSTRLNVVMKMASATVTVLTERFPIENKYFKADSWRKKMNVYHSLTSTKEYKQDLVSAGFKVN